MSEPNSALETDSGDDQLAELTEDFLSRYRAGERPAVDEYASKYPELAHRIRDVLTAVVMMEQPGVDGACAFPPSSEREGAIIGRYKLLERMGEGGFGVVYMAEQQHPVRRKVAIKVIKPGFDTRQVIARFEAERQALALMEHPNIAKILDAGTTGDQARVGDGERGRGGEHHQAPLRISPSPSLPMRQQAKSTWPSRSTRRWLHGARRRWGPDT